MFILNIDMLRIEFLCLWRGLLGGGMDLLRARVPCERDVSKNFKRISTNKPRFSRELMDFWLFDLIL
jgi:hypothetical protein